VLDSALLYAHLLLCLYGMHAYYKLVICVHVANVFCSSLSRTPVKRATYY